MGKLFKFVREEKGKYHVDLPASRCILVAKDKRIKRMFLVWSTRKYGSSYVGYSEGEPFTTPRETFLRLFLVLPVELKPYSGSPVYKQDLAYLIQHNHVTIESLYL